MMDEYRKGWALRYLREAKAELQAAKKTSYMAPSLFIEAIRKARNAIYYSLGEPAFVETVIRESAEKAQQIEDPVLKFLVEIEATVQHLGQMEEINEENVMNQADNLVQIASDIVEAIFGEKVED